MDKCRIFSQHLFGAEKGINYQLLDTKEMMSIKKSKRKLSIAGLGWDSLKGRYMVHMKDDGETTNLLESRTSSTLSLNSQVDGIDAACCAKDFKHGEMKDKGCQVNGNPKEQNSQKVSPSGMKNNVGCHREQQKLNTKGKKKHVRFETESIKPNPTICLGKTLEESGGSNVYLDGNGEYLVIGGKRYTAKFVFEQNARQDRKDAATQYNRMDFLNVGEEYYV